MTELNAVYLRLRLKGIVEIIDAVENRCMAADGPVTPTRLEMTDDELRQIYRLATGSYRKRKRIGTHRESK